MRGSKFREGYHDYVILTGGLTVFPRLVAAEHHTAFKREPVSSGIPELDALMGGGFDRGTCSLITGAAGTGKSSMAMLYAWQAAKRGERVLAFTFDETLGLLRARTSSLGMDLEPFLKSGTLDVRQVDPAELSPGELTAQIRRGVENGVKVIIVDSLNGYLNAMPAEKFLNIQFHELCSYLNQQGVMTILLLAQQGLIGSTDVPVDISYLADTVVTLRYFEAAGVVKQAIAVVKKRSGPHEKTIREFKLEPGVGVRIGQALTQFQGVLTGVPTFHGTSDAILPTSGPS